MKTRAGTFVREALRSLRWPIGHETIEPTKIPPEGDLDKLHPDLSRSIRAALEAGMTQSELAAKLREVAS